MYKVSLEITHCEASFKSRLFFFHFICINLETQWKQNKPKIHMIWNLKYIFKEKPNN